ncbi:MAG: DNA circularization N-terminal domain-containing protein [Pseudomonadota bacterium]
MSWPDTYLEASFRDIPFDFLSTGEEVSRSTVAHSYPFRDGADVEDLGLSAKRHTVRAMLFGANADSRYQQLIDALDAPDAGWLSHPVYGYVWAVVEGYRPAFDADNTDSVALDITFIEQLRTVRMFELAIPEAKLNALTNAIAETSTLADETFAQKLRNLLALANNNRLTQLVATISQTMAQVAQISQAVQNTVQSYLDMPSSLMSDLHAMLGALSPHLDTSGLNNLLGGGTAAPAASVQSYAATESQLTVATTFPALAAGTPVETQQDAALITVNAQLVAALTCVQTAQVVLAAELAQPTATPLQIEAMANAVRGSLQVQIDALAALYPLESSRPLIESLKNTALLVQQSAQLVIETRPPLVVKKSPVSGNLRLIAHALYGDHTRATELARLNPLIRQPNFIQQGDALNAFAQ